MTPETYRTLIRYFLWLMPIELLIVTAFAWACILKHQTHQPAFWCALLCIGVLVPEILRSICILTGDMPPHRKEFQLWLVEMLPFGGFVYDVTKRYLVKLWLNVRNN